MICSSFSAVVYAGLPLAARHVVDLADGAGAALPEDAQDRQLGVGRSRGGGSGHGREYLRTPS